MPVPKHDMIVVSVQIGSPDLISTLSWLSVYYCFPLILQREKLTKKCRGAKLQVTQKITSRSPLRFWRSVPIGVWSARDHFVPLTMRAMRFPSRLVRGIRE